MTTTFYTLSEAAQKLNISEDAVRDLARSRRIAEFGKFNEWKYRRDQIDQMAVSQNFGPVVKGSHVPHDMADVKVQMLVIPPPRMPSRNTDDIQSTINPKAMDDIIDKIRKEGYFPSPKKAKKPPKPKTTRRALYVGSFDPPTNGHVWVIEEASELFDEVIVGVGINPKKSYTLSMEERQNILEAIVQPLGNVKVKTLGTKLSAKFAEANDCNYIVQGIRSLEDYEYQKAARYANARIAANVKTVWVVPPSELIEVSSSFVKGLVGFEDWESVVEKLVPTAVFEKLKAKA